MLRVFHRQTGGVHEPSVSAGRNGEDHLTRSHPRPVRRRISDQADHGGPVVHRADMAAHATDRIGPGCSHASRRRLDIRDRRLRLAAILRHHEQTRIQASQRLPGNRRSGGGIAARRPVVLRKAAPERTCLAGESAEPAGKFLFFRGLLEADHCCQRRDRHGHRLLDGWMREPHGPLLHPQQFPTQAGSIHVGGLHASPTGDLPLACHVRGGRKKHLFNGVERDPPRLSARRVGRGTHHRHSRALFHPRHDSRERLAVAKPDHSLARVIKRERAAPPR